MREKLMVGTHRYTTKEYAEGWDRIFGKKLQVPSCQRCQHFWPCMRHDTKEAMTRWINCNGFSEFTPHPCRESQI